MQFYFGAKVTDADFKKIGGIATYFDNVRTFLEWQAIDPQADFSSGEGQFFARQCRGQDGLETLFQLRCGEAIG